MNYGALGFGRSFPRAWILPLSLFTLLLVLAAVGTFSRSMAADVVAWWPVWVGLGVAAYLLRERSYQGFRFAGLVPLAALAFVLLFAWGHVAGWAIMPSASQRLIGPEVGETGAGSMLVEIDGRLVVSGRDMSELYVVEPVRRGGSIPPPSAGEASSGDRLDIVLTETTDSGMYTFAGWEIRLVPTVGWDLVLDGAVEADLTGLTIESLRLDGAGEVVLGPLEGSGEVIVSGSYRLVVPAGSPASVRGVAAVPGSWLLTNGGAVSPSTGDGWSIEVVPGSTVVIAER